MQNLRLQSRPTKSELAFLTGSPSSVYAHESLSSTVLKDSAINFTTVVFMDARWMLRHGVCISRKEGGRRRREREKGKYQLRLFPLEKVSWEPPHPATSPTSH